MSHDIPDRTPPALQVYRTALQAQWAGISVVPIRPDGSKRPCCCWRTYQYRRATYREITSWFARSRNGLAFITGAVSGGLEVLDFDTPDIFHAWCTSMHEGGLDALCTRLTSGYLEASPSGIHLLYRSETIEGNQKLASVPGDHPRRVKTLIETRGEGGLIIVAPSAGGVHPSGKPYVLVQGGITSIATVSSEERQRLFTVARTLDTPAGKEPRHPRGSSFSATSPRQSFSMGSRPGDRYNQRVTWQEVLEPHGWKLLWTAQGTGYWQHPEKTNTGVSATTNHHGSDMLYVFSTSTVFEPERGYTKFAAYTLLEHQGNYSVAAKALLGLGY